MKNIYKIAVIGSRETDELTMAEMYNSLLTGLTLLSEKGIAVEYRSGGCWKGPDQLQFMIARKEENNQLTATGREQALHVNHVCYLADEKKLWLRRRYTTVEFRVIAQDERYREVVGQLHPAPEKLQEFAWALHGRNLNIIMGDDLDSPVDAVYYSAPLTKYGNPTGGTGMGVKYAKQCGIPCYHHARDGQAWLESLRLL